MERHATIATHALPYEPHPSFGRSSSGLPTIGGTFVLIVFVFIPHGDRPLRRLRMCIDPDSKHVAKPLITYTDRKVGLFVMASDLLLTPSSTSCSSPKMMSEEHKINVCKTGLGRIYSMLRDSPETYSAYLGLGRMVIAHINTTTFMQQPARKAEQSWMVAGLQRLAALDNGYGGTQDITTWCSQQWTILHQRDPQSVAALRGLGQTWSVRAQPALARIHRVENNSDSSGNSSQISTMSMTSSEDERQNSAATEEAERRAGTQDYVEARGYLQPGTEYLRRAVEAATQQRTLSGDLLATTAEAFMSLGNVTSPRTNEQYFRRAVQLLRAASQVEGYSLSRYLQQYLDDYGRLID